MYPYLLQPVAHTNEQNTMQKSKRNNHMDYSMHTPVNPRLI